MSNIIREPNINSTVIMRADIMIENIFDANKGDTKFVSKSIGQIPSFPDQKNDDSVLYRYYDDVRLRDIPLYNSQIKFMPKIEIVRRIIPRNPFKDYIINQTSVVLADSSQNSVLVVYIPHVEHEKEIPFYLPVVYGIAILYHQQQMSIHYLPFNYTDSQQERILRQLDPNDRSIRIAHRLLETSCKHSQGLKDGYSKRVHHDLIVPREAFQNRYISLKKKYSSTLVNQWVEKTDPKKHVFEDLAIAAFLIEFWRLNGFLEFQFLDIGCGNGLLVYILHMEGYKGKGVDARRRKSWDTYPHETQAMLQEKIFIPSIILEPDSKEKYFAVANVDGLVQYHLSTKLIQADYVMTTNDIPHDTFLIGNHSDELTCWLPLMGFPFMVIPCCSHGLSGAKKRYTKSKQVLTYASLVEHVQDLAKSVGWITEKEYLRIPSTRNVALVGFNKHLKVKDQTSEHFNEQVLEIIHREGGADAWVENCINLMKLPPRDH